MIPHNPRVTPWDSGCIKNLSEIHLRLRQARFTLKPVFSSVCNRWYTTHNHPGRCPGLG